MRADRDFLTANLNFPAYRSKTEKKQVRQPQTKPWDRLSHLLNTIVSICVAWWPARHSPMLDRGVLRNSVKRRMLSMSRILFAGIAALWGITAAAQSHTIYVEPLFVYEAWNNPTFASTSIAAVFANAAAQVAALSDASYTYSAMNNLHAYDPVDAPFYYDDGIPVDYRFGLQGCSLDTGQCWQTPDWGLIGMDYVCPAGSANGRIIIHLPSINSSRVRCQFPTFNRRRRTARPA
jgi:hypothetical protein